MGRYRLSTDAGPDLLGDGRGALLQGIAQGFSAPLLLCIDRLLELRIAQSTPVHGHRTAQRCLLLERIRFRRRQMPPFLEHIPARGRGRTRSPGRFTGPPHPGDRVRRPLYRDLRLCLMQPGSRRLHVRQQVFAEGDPDVLGGPRAAGQCDGGDQTRGCGSQGMLERDLLSLADDSDRLGLGWTANRRARYRRLSESLAAACRRACRARLHRRLGRQPAG